jgi:hypothetical protein
MISDRSIELSLWNRVLVIAAFPLSEVGCGHEEVAMSREGLGAAAARGARR